MIGLLVWVFGAGAVVYEAYAWLTGHTTVSRASGWWRIGLIAWIITFVSHLLLEWNAEALGKAAADSFGAIDR